MANRWIMRDGEKVLQQIVLGPYDETWQDVELREETTYYEDCRDGKKVIKQK